MRNRRICITLIFSANLILETPPIVSVSPGAVVQNYFCHCPGGLSPGSSRNLVTTDPMILRTERNQRIAGAPTLPLEFDSLSPKRTQLASLFVGLAVSMLLVFGLSGCAPSTEDQISSTALIDPNDYSPNYLRWVRRPTDHLHMRAIAEKCCSTPNIGTTTRVEPRRLCRCSRSGFTFFQSRR